MLLKAPHATRPSRARTPSPRRGPQPRRGPITSDVISDKQLSASRLSALRDPRTSTAGQVPFFPARARREDPLALALLPEQPRPAPTRRNCHPRARLAKRKTGADS